MRFASGVSGSFSGLANDPPINTYCGIYKIPHTVYSYFIGSIIRAELSQQNSKENGLLQQAASNYSEVLMAKPTEVPPNGWDKEYIKGELHRQNMTLKRLAEAIGMAPNSFSHVWTRPVRKAEAAIAEFLETPLKELWPDRYPIRTARILSSKYDNYRASQKGNAATDKKAA